MARIRTIKPEFFRSRSLSRVSIAARVTFQGLWCEADDHGRGIADERLLTGALWALDDEITPPVVADHLVKLAETGHIRLYTVEDESYYEIVGWEKHQAASYRRGEPIHPSPPAETPPNGAPHDESCKKVPAARPAVLEGKGTGNREGKGTGRSESPHVEDGPDPPQGVSDAFGADVPRFCDQLADRIEANGSKRPAVTKTWLIECDRMLRLDNRTPEQVAHVIDWCQQDPFWRSNVLSMPKLREQFDRLRLAAKRAGAKAPNGQRSSLSLVMEMLENEPAGEAG